MIKLAQFFGDAIFEGEKATIHTIITVIFHINKNFDAFFPILSFHF